MAEALPKIVINNETPLRTAELRSFSVYQHADPDNVLPNVILAETEINPRDRPHRIAQRVGIHDTDGDVVGALNLVQTAERSWINDVRINEARRGERLAVSAYIGIVATLHQVGRTLESDPGGLSKDSVRVWESLQRRGLAQETEGVDQHGNQRYISSVPTLTK